MLVFLHLLTYTWGFFYKFVPDVDCMRGPLWTPIPIRVEVQHATYYLDKWHWG